MSADALEFTKDWSDEKFFREAQDLTENWQETAGHYSYDGMLLQAGEHRGIYVPYLMNAAMHIKETGKCDRRLERCCCRRHLGSGAEPDAIRQQMREIIERVYRSGMARGHRIAKGQQIEGPEFTEVKL